MIDVTEVTPVSLAYLVLGGFVVAFSMISLLVKEKLYIGEVVLGTGFGVLIGPHCANIFNPRDWGGHDNSRVTLEFLRIVLATGLFAIGVELPKAYLAEHARSLLIMVVPTMAFGWVVSAGIMMALFPRLDYVSALVISACLTPTDPILAAAIIGGKFAIKNVPGHIRRLLSAESAANDGLAYPFLSISLYLTVESSTRVAIGKWFLVGWLYQVILGTVLGGVLGYSFSYLMKISHRKGLIDRESFLSQYLALSIFTIGIASTIGSDDLLAAFAAGSAISWDGHFNTHTEDEVFSSVLDLLLNCACFIYIGAWLPFDTYNTPFLGIVPWKLVVLFLIILVLRRIPVLLAMYKWVPDIKNWREALFCGHFGPMGVGAIFISTLALTRLPTAHNPPQNQTDILVLTLQPIVSFVVLCSILIHGLSIPAFWFGRKVRSRTVTMTTSFSRTFTSRGQEQQPDWLLWARRAPAVTSPPSSPAALPDVETGSPSPGNPSYGLQVESPHGTLVDRRTRGSSNERRVEKIRSTPTSSAPRTRTGTPVQESPIQEHTPHHSVFNLESAAGTRSRVQFHDEVERDITSNDMKEAGYGFASLHDKEENRQTDQVINDHHQVEDTIPATSSGAGKADETPPQEEIESSSAAKQVQFAQ